MTEFGGTCLFLELLGYSLIFNVLPVVASSDATNLRGTITKEGDEVVVNCHKWVRVCFGLEGTFPPRPLSLILHSTEPYSGSPAPVILVMQSISLSVFPIPTTHLLISDTLSS